MNPWGKGKGLVGLFNVDIQLFQQPVLKQLTLLCGSRDWEETGISKGREEACGGDGYVHILTGDRFTGITRMVYFK